MNEVKDTIDETQNKESAVTDNPVINDPSYFNLFGCGEKLLNNLDATCGQACMVTSKDKYYMEMWNTLTDYNERNNTPLSSANI